MGKQDYEKPEGQVSNQWESKITGNGKDRYLVRNKNQRTKVRSPIRVYLLTTSSVDLLQCNIVNIILVLYI